MKEKCFVWACSLIWIFTPLLFIEFFPFTFTPMYSANCTKATYFQLSEKNRYYAPSDFGLLQKNCGLFDYYGRAQPESINLLGGFLKEANVKKVVIQSLRKFPHIHKLKVEQFNIGVRNDNNIGILKRRIFQIDNPYHNRTSKTFVKENRHHLLFRVKNKKINPFFLGSKD